MKKILLFCLFGLLLFPQSFFPQANEFAVTEMPSTGKFPAVMSSHPGTVVLVIFSAISDLEFGSNTNGIIDKIKADDKYYLFLKPENQSIEIKCNGYAENTLPVIGLQAEEVKYFKIEPRNDQSGISIPVTISVTPTNSKIFVDETPFQSYPQPKLTRGVHKLRLEADGCKPAEISIEVDENHNTFTYLLNSNDISTGELNISIVPNDCAVCIDGVERLDFENTTLFAGKHAIRISKQGYYTESETLELQPGSQMSRHFTLTEKPTRAVISIGILAGAGFFNQRGGTIVNEADREYPNWAIGPVVHYQFEKSQFGFRSGLFYESLRFTQIGDNPQISTYTQKFSYLEIPLLVSYRCDFIADDLYSRLKPVFVYLGPSFGFQLEKQVDKSPGLAVVSQKQFGDHKLKTELAAGLFGLTGSIFYDIHFNILLFDDSDSLPGSFVIQAGWFFN